MGIFATISMLVIFPLNFLLAFQGDWVQGKEQVVIKDSINDIGEVKGVEKSKEEVVVLAPKVFVNSDLAPIKKTGSENLVINKAHASVVLDVDSGTILNANNENVRRQIASLTKIMTATLVVERVKDLDEVVTIDEEAVYIEGTKIGCPRSGYCISQRLKIGERITVRSLLKAMLMNSANDAAIALGKHVAGSEAEFVKIMNEKAKSLGLTDTNFCTSSGLEPDGREKECYSTASDIARIAAYSLKYDTIWSTCRLPNNTNITSSDGKIIHTILNTDQVIDQIPNLIGGKTGFTPNAGYSLLMIAADQSGKHKVVSVLLDDPHRWQDIKTMFSWTFKSFVWK